MDIADLKGMFLGCFGLKWSHCHGLLLLLPQGLTHCCLGSWNSDNDLFPVALSQTHSSHYSWSKASPSSLVGGLEAGFREPLSPGKPTSSYLQECVLGAHSFSRNALGKQE